MNCYINNPRSGAPHPQGLTKENTLFYPEASMTTAECFKTARPDKYHIVTDSAFLPGLYKRDEVFVWDGSTWVNPKINTYGASYSLILQEIFGFTNSIPQAVIDGNVTNCMGHPIKT